MSGLSPIDLRQRIEAELVGRLSPNGWAKSSVLYDLFPGSGDLMDRSGLSFAVGLVRTVPGPGRQPTSSGGLAVVTSTIGVRFGVSLATDAGTADYDRALAREMELVAAAMGPGVLGSPVTGGPRPVLEGIDRSVDPTGTLYVGDLTFAVLHTYSLTG